MKIPLWHRMPIVHKPGVVVRLLACTVAVMAVTSMVVGENWRRLFLAGTSIYGLALVTAGFCMYRMRRLERPLRFGKPERILIIAPHQDDCVLAAGGIGARNVRLGGTTYIVYLAADGRIQEARQREAVAAWRLAGLPEDQIYHFDALPRLGTRDPTKIEQAREILQNLFDELRPTLVFMPSFEGGHVQHDLTNYVVSFLIKRPEDARIYECPEYSPYLSLMNTPHRALGLASRVFAGRFPYFGPPDGIDGRKIWVLDMDEEELSLKREMLLQFRSQQITATHSCYRDRFLEWGEARYKAQPFRYGWSTSHISSVLRRFLPDYVVGKLLPGQYKSYGLADGITDLDLELGATSWTSRS